MKTTNWGWFYFIKDVLVSTYQYLLGQNLNNVRNIFVIVNCNQTVFLIETTVLVVGYFLVELIQWHS